MPTDDWGKIQKLFLAAADLPPAEQQRFLDGACADDPPLRREIESLLPSDRDGEQSIAAAVAGAAQDLLGGDPLIGARLGRWRVECEIGCGGMGAVYLATRDDHDYEQQAAIKLVKEGMDTAQLLDRFRHERQILANLNHPYIARLIDGGSTEQGRPYLVMEYVEGRPIDAWLKEREVGLEDRCRLFLRVCDAVSYAHRNLVVHRDLKPSNILIAPDGLPKLLDFGVAKLLAPDRDPGITAAGSEFRAITPDYASPEQLLGLPVTTTTDVYSLGAILYELLTGGKPRRARSPSLEEWPRVAGENEIARPGDAAPPNLPGAARLRRRLAGDLDNIVLMAMRQEPERRYPSVDEFAADLRRYLAGEPVVARRDSVAYRSGKFVRRHLLGLAMLFLVAFSLLAGTTLALMQARRADAARRVADAQRQAADVARQSAEREHDDANRERDAALRDRVRAESEARLADERLAQMVALANHSLFDIHSQIERLPGATEARRGIVGTTLQYLEELSKTAGDDAPLRQALAAAYLKLGDVQGYPFGPSLGDAAGALESYRRAADLLLPLRRSRPRDPDLLHPWVDLQFRIGALLGAKGQVDRAVDCLTAALPDAALLGKLRPHDTDAASREAVMFKAIAVALETRDAATAQAWSQRALAAFEALAVRFPKSETLLEQLADAHSRAGVGLNQTGNLRGALTEYRLSAEVRERLASAHPNDVERRRDLMMAYGHVAAVLGDPLVLNLGDSEGARAYYQKAADLAVQNAGADRQNLTALYDVAAVMLRLGVVDAPPSGLERSRETLRKAAATLESLVARSPSDSRYKSQLANAQEFIGERLRALGRLPEAIASYRQALAGGESALAADPSNRSAYAQTTATSSGLVRALAASGERVEALSQARAAIARAEACSAHSPEKVSCARYQAIARLALAATYRIFAAAPSAQADQRESDWREARAAAERALRDTAANPGSESAAVYAPLLAEAHGLIAESAEHLR
jgi:tetratricopeptide (TPR) repeat protein